MPLVANNDNLMENKLLKNVNNDIIKETISLKN